MNAKISWSLWDSLENGVFSDLGQRAAMIVVDVPIGLTEGPARACDRLARRTLGPRRSSVFTPPMRAMLAMPDRASASVHGKAMRKGGGLSVQAWNIADKIREADAMMTPALQVRVREGHPEVAFTRIGGKPPEHSKKTVAGKAERLALLSRGGIDASEVLQEVAAARPRIAAPDDVLDAAMLSLTARDAVSGGAWVLGGECDARGVRMEILG